MLKVSVAIPVYNSAKQLAVTLDSLAHQTMPASDFEIICVNDCSTDNTWSILQQYADKDERVKPYRNEYNLGHTLNFGKAISLCKGEYIALSDQDDIWETDKIASLIENVGDVVLIYHDSDFIGERCKRI